MKNVADLSETVGLHSIESGRKLQKAALAQGFTQEELDAIAQEEMAAHGSWSYLAFKAKVVGTAFATLIPFFLVTMSVSNPNPSAYVARMVFLLLAIVGGLSLAQWGRREEKRAAVAGAVLRARAKGLTHDEISVLKDQPELRGDRDTQRMLTSVQDQLAKQVAPAT